jgi:hypothetical protein
LDKTTTTKKVANWNMGGSSKAKIRQAYSLPCEEHFGKRAGLIFVWFNELKQPITWLFSNEGWYFGSNKRT